LVFARWKTVVFVNGCFWHRHRGCERAGNPKSNRSFWRQKFTANVRRDKANYAALAKMGWKVVVLWQCEVKTARDAVGKLKRHFRR
jgi:DNA mismatch endonuclease (patch repair protein)